MWCNHCVADNEAVRESNSDCVSCSVCGKILGCFVSKSQRMIGKQKKVKGLRGRAMKLGNLFDFDDFEAAQCLYSEKEKHLRKIIWEEMHKEYLQEQAAKAASQDGLAKDISSEKLISAQDLAKLVATALTKSTKEKKRKHPTNKRNSTVKQKSNKSKINYEALENPCKDNTKKQVAASEGGECENDGIKAIEEDTLKESEDSALNNAEDHIDVDGENDGNDYYNNEDDDYYGNEEDDYYEKQDEEYYDEWDS